MKSRQVLLVALMATVLCTERVATAAPGLSPQIGRTMRQLAVKLTDSFQQVLPNVRPQQGLTLTPALSLSTGRGSFVDQPVVHPAEITPFQFRLPPPLA